MRDYEPIWIRLKNLPKKDAAEKGVSIVVNRLLHKRIVKAVTKEKWMDIGYKLTNYPRIAVMTHESKGSTLTFYLTQSFTEEDF